MEWHPAGWLVCQPLLIFPFTIKPRSSLLAPADLGGPGKRSLKTVVVCINNSVVMEAISRGFKSCLTMGVFVCWWLTRGFTSLLHDELHWLDVPERVQYKLCSMVHRCLQPAQGTTVHERLLHPCLGHCSSAAPAVCWLLSAACAVTPSSDLFSGRLGTRYQTIFVIRCILWTVFVVTWKLFCSRSTSVHSALGALRLCAV